jgi:hypothetical protein
MAKGKGKDRGFAGTTVAKPKPSALETLRSGVSQATSTLSSSDTLYFDGALATSILADGGHPKRLVCTARMLDARGGRDERWRRCHPMRARLNAAPAVLCPQALNRTISGMALTQAMEVTLETASLLPGEDTRLYEPVDTPWGPGERSSPQRHGAAAEKELERARAMATVPQLIGLPKTHPVFGRWELTFVSFQSLPIPFYVPGENMITLKRVGPFRISAQANVAGLPVTLGSFIVNENSTRSGRPDAEGDGVLYGMQLEALKPGAKVYDLTIYKGEDDDLPVLVARSSDGKEKWLLSSMEAKMRRREANARKYAREIMNLERRAEAYSKNDDMTSGYRALKDAWRNIFKDLDARWGTSLASSNFLIEMAPFFPFVLLGFILAVSLGNNSHFGGMGFLH